MLDLPTKLASRLRWSIKRRGVRGTIKMVPHVVTSRFANRFSAEGRAYVHADREFDERYGGIDTAGFISPVELDFQGDAKEGANGYQAVSETAIREMMGTLDVDLSKFTFVDFGSGKGRACLLASEFPFEEIIGVELSESLHVMAVNNVRKFSPPWPQRCREIRPIRADATTYELPERPLVIFMYNPFLADVLGQVAARVSRSIDENPREAYLFYAQPIHSEVFEEFATVKPLEKRDSWISYTIGA